MKSFSTATVLSFLVATSFMSNVAVAVPVESSSDGTPARLVKRQGPAPNPISDSVLDGAGQLLGNILGNVPTGSS
ncbi:hypothetical protein AX14_004968 [Amanita brunnescens Koide BX004]|nr:hypothetical protein AX14_004968 [Amanita brunnescens Koide BX004]